MKIPETGSLDRLRQELAKYWCVTTIFWLDDISFALIRDGQ
jgi:hypothetical protein